MRFELVKNIITEPRGREKMRTSREGLDLERWSVHSLLQTTVMSRICYPYLNSVSRYLVDAIRKTNNTAENINNINYQAVERPSRSSVGYDPITF